MKLSEMRALLQGGNIQLTKSLGQNFLHDANQLRKIAEAGEIKPNDKILEIGPGLGPLTSELLERAGHVLAIEKDQRLVPILRERFGTRSNFELLNADALHHIQGKYHDWRGWKMVSNLPYSVASPILVELARGAHCPDRMVATLQLEVVERIVAKQDEDQYGLLTLLIGFNYESAGYFKIPSNCFHPAPDVESACVTLVRRRAPLLPSESQRAFERVVKRSFSQRRKMMFKLLKGDWSEDSLLKGFGAAGIDRMARAETISIEQFATLTHSLEQSKAPAHE